MQHCIALLLAWLLCFTSFSHCISMKCIIISVNVLLHNVYALCNKYFMVYLIVIVVRVAPNRVLKCSISVNIVCCEIYFFYKLR